MLSQVTVPAGGASEGWSGALRSMANAIPGGPRTLILDEPVNGLNPEGR